MVDSTGAPLPQFPVAGQDYPLDVAQLRAWFPTDAACLDYLDWLRWPTGFLCPLCQADTPGVDVGCRSPLARSLIRLALR